MIDLSARRCRVERYLMTGHLIRCDWDTGGRGPGIYGIPGEVTADELYRQTITREVTAVRQVPRPEVRREVTGHDRYFEMALTVENRGDGGYLLLEHR